MCMSVLERRVQILVERSQYERLERMARSEQRSVASLIREAIGEYLDPGSEKRVQAMDALLAMPTDTGPGEDWADAKRLLELPEYP